MTTNSLSNSTNRYTVDQPLWLVCCNYNLCVCFCKKELGTQKQKVQLDHSIQHQSMQDQSIIIIFNSIKLGSKYQSSSWYIVDWSDKLSGSLLVTTKKLIIEFSIQRRRIWKKEGIQMKRIIMLLDLHLCKGIWFIVNVFV